MKKSKLLLILAILVALTMVIAACDKDCAHETYSAWKITKAPTTDEAGEAIRVCAECGVADTTVVAKLSDTSVWTAASSTATHTSAGKIVYTSTTFGTVEVFVDRLGDHVYDKEVATDAYLVSAADCTHAAVYRKSCECGAVGTATFTKGTALGHNGKEVAAVAAVHTATTLTNGTKAHYECERCGLLFSDAACTTEVTAESLVVVVAHDFGGWTLVADATCTEDGSVTRTCATCGKVDEGVIPAHDHVYTSGKIVLVTSKDVVQEEDGEIIEGDEEATEFHAPVCDICGVVNKDAKVAHEFGDEYLIIKEAVSGREIYHEAFRRHKCDACGYVEPVGDKTLSGVLDSLGYVDGPQTDWTKGETVAATYISDGYTVYTKGKYEVKLPIAKYVAPYEGKTYVPFDLDMRDKVAGTVNPYIWSGAKITVDSLGKATGTASPFNGDVVITMVDDTTGKISLTVNSTTYEGYVEPSTGIMVISDNGFTSRVYVVTPYDVIRDDATASFWTNAMAINYHIDCGTYLGHDIGILINDGVVHFGVNFANEEGNSVKVNEIYVDNDGVLTLAVEALVAFVGDELAEDNVVAIYVKNSKGVLLEADAYIGEYSAVMDIDSMTDVPIGTLYVNGVGEFMLDTEDGYCTGTYVVVYDGDEVAYVDAYVLVDGKKVEHYHATVVDSDTIKLVPQKVTITLDAGEHGTSETVSVFTNCVVNILPAVSNDGEYIFVRWMNGDVAVTATTTFNSNVTLTAVWASNATVTIVDRGNTTTDSISVITPIMQAEALPKHVKDATVDTTNNTIFVGWYLTEDFSGDPINDETVPGAEAVTVYAKWEQGGVWNAFDNDRSFAYNSEIDAWRTTNYANSTTYARFNAIDGNIVVSFDYYFGSRSGSSDSLMIKNGSTTVVSTIYNTSASSPLEDSKQSLSVLVKSGTCLEIQAKYYSTNNDTNGVYIANLKINGISITQKGTYDLLGDTYTCEGKDDLVLDGHGNFTWGEKSGTYVRKTNTSAALTVISDGNPVEGYAVTLTGNTFVTAPLMFKVTLHFGELYYPNIDKVNGVTTTPQVVEVEAYKPYVLPEAQTFTGALFLGWFKSYTGNNLLTEITPTADMDVYGRYNPTIVIKYNDTVNNYVNKEVEALKGVALGDHLLTPEVTTDGDRIFLGWFTGDGTDGVWGTEVTSTSTLSEDTTLYAKWAVPHALMGTYMGYESYYKTSTGTGQKTMTIDVAGNVTWTKTNGVIEDYDSEKGTFVIDSNGTKRYAYYDAVSQTIVTIDGSGTKLSDDIHVLTKVANSSVAVSISSNANEKVAKWGDTAQILQFTVAGTLRTFFVYEEKVYGDVIVKVNGADVTTLATVKVTGNVTAITRDNVELFKGIWNGTTFMGQGDEEGNYTGTIGTASGIYLDGFGVATIGDDTATYTIDGNKITVVLNNRMMVIELGEGTCAQVQDGYAETYTLPNDAGTITLDGLGGAGDGATYVVKGTQITIYTAEGSTTYGIDVTNKKLSSKSEFAGLTFTGTYYDEWDECTTKLSIVFDDASTISGVLYKGEVGSAYFFNFTAKLSGNVLTITFGDTIGNTGNGKTIIATITGSTMTISKGTFSTNGTYSFWNNGSATCEGFSL